MSKRASDFLGAWVAQNARMELFLERDDPILDPIYDQFIADASAANLPLEALREEVGDLREFLVQAFETANERNPPLDDQPTPTVPIGRKLPR